MKGFVIRDKTGPGLLDTLSNSFFVNIATQQNFACINDRGRFSEHSTRDVHGGQPIRERENERTRSKDQANYFRSY